MKFLCGLFFVVALAGAASGATIGSKVEQAQLPAFTSELDDGFVATLSKTAVDANKEDKENSLEPQQHIQKSPALLVQEEAQIPVAIVVEQEKVVKKNVDPVNVPVEVKPVVKIEEKQEEITDVNAAVKPENDALKPENNAAESEKKAEESQSDKENHKEDKQGEPLEQGKQSNASSSTSNNPPNILQQGLISIGQGIQSIGVSIASLVSSPPASSTADQPPNIFASVQQTLQNILRPPSVSSDDPAVSPAPIPGIFEGIQNFTQGISQSIQNLSQNFINFISGATQQNSPNRNSSLLQEGIQSLEQGVQTGLQNLNQSIQSVTNPPSSDRPNSPIQVGLQNLQQGVQNLTSGIQNIFRPQNDDNATRPGLIQQTVQNLSQGLQTGIQNLNNTIQNIINPSSDAGENASRPGILQQGIQTFQNGLQNLIRGNDSTPAVQTRETIEETFFKQLQLINETLHEGVRSLRNSLQGVVDIGVNTASEGKVPEGSAQVVDA